MNEVYISQFWQQLTHRKIQGARCAAPRRAGRKRSRRSLRYSLVADFSRKAVLRIFRNSIRENDVEFLKNKKQERDLMSRATELEVSIFTKSEDFRKRAPGLCRQSYYAIRNDVVVAVFLFFLPESGDIAMFPAARRLCPTPSDPISPQISGRGELRFKCENRLSPEGLKSNRTVCVCVLCLSYLA